MKTLWIHGHVHLQTLPRDFRGIIRVQLLDSTRADSKSLVLAETLIRDPVVLLQGTYALPFRLALSEHVLTPGNLTLRAHVDSNATGMVKSGDQVTVESYPVTTADIDLPHEIHVQRID